MLSSLHIIGAKKFGGAENFFIRLINALHQRNHPVTAVSPPHCELSPLINVEIHQRHFHMKNVYDIISKWQIKSLAKKSQVDIVQTYMGRATRLTQLNKKHSAIHIARLGGFYNLKGYRHAHAWIGNTKGICDYLINNKFPSEKVFHISNFVDPAVHATDQELQALRLSLGLTTEDKVILSIGRLHPNKGFDTLLKAFSLFKKKNNERYHLVIVGDGPLKQELAKLTNELQLEKNTHFTGWQTNTSLYYSLADYFVCASRHEPLGNVILEAWSYQIPVLTTKTHGPLEYIEDNTNAILVEVDNPVNMADELLQLVGNPVAASELAQQGKSKLTSQFSESIIVDQYLSTYHELVNAKK